MSRLSIVTPVYNEEEIIEEFCLTVARVMNETAYEWELICCVDPGTDHTLEILQSIRKEIPNVKIIEFARRCGQDRALLVGMNFSSGEAVVTMDCDLQDPPNVIPLMLEKWQDGAKVVLGVRESREGEKFSKVFLSKLFHRFLSKFGENSFPKDTGEFRLLDRSIVRQVLLFKESSPFLRGIINLVSYDVGQISFPRPSRSKGYTKYNRFLGGYKVAVNGIFSFTDAPLKIIKLTGLFVSIFSFLFSIYFAISTLINREVPSGTTTIICFVGLIGGLNLLCLSVVTSYLSQIWREVKSRPSYTIRKIEGMEKSN